MPSVISYLFNKVFFFFFPTYYFIFVCAQSSLPCPGFLQLQRAGATPCCSGQPCHCSGSSCHQALGRMGFSSCGAELLHGMWNLPGPRMEPVSPTLAGIFLSIVPQGKSKLFFFFHLLSEAGILVFDLLDSPILSAICHSPQCAHLCSLK